MESAPDDSAPEGMGLIERGAGLLFQQLLDDIAPNLDQMGQDMSGALNRLAPAMTDLARLMDDIGNYETPERLENGDILIRRKADAPPPPAMDEGLRRFTEPDPRAPVDIPIDLDAPQIEL